MNSEKKIPKKIPESLIFSWSGVGMGVQGFNFNVKASLLLDVEPAAHTTGVLFSPHYVKNVVTAALEHALAHAYLGLDPAGS